MSYLNRFLIDEDLQFECAEVLDYENNKTYPIRQSLEKSLERVSNKSNSDLFFHLVLSNDFKYSTTCTSFLQNVINSIIQGQNFTFMITRIGSERLECVQKEQYEKFYNEGGEITYNQNSSAQHFQVYKSVGDDIDHFYDRIKINEIKLTDSKSRDSGILCYRIIPELLHSTDSVKTFHLSMLSDEEEKKMHSEKTGNRIFANFRNETRLTENEQNYALSLCVRKTIYCERRSEITKRQSYGALPVLIRLLDIVEPDFWQERIKQNFEEFARNPHATRKRKAQEALEVLKYYQTDRQSDSSNDFDSN